MSAYIVGIENNIISSSDAINRILKVLRFISKSRQGVERDATGYKGFYKYFLDMKTGRIQYIYAGPLFIYSLIYGLIFVEFKTI